MPLLGSTKIPLTKNKDTVTFPATECFLKKFGVNQETINAWKEKRKFKKLNVRYDERLRQYQKDGIEKILQLDSIGVFDQQRLGKTPMVLSSLNHRLLNKVIIIAPKSTIVNWVQECKKWYTDSVAGAIGTKQQREKIYNSNTKVIVINYTTAMLDLEILPNPDCIIIDEAHRLKNYKGDRAKKSPKMTIAIMKLSRKANYRIALTGTPASNRSENVYPILHFLYPNLFTSYYQFIEYYYETEKMYIGRNQTIDEVTGFKKGKQQELLEFIDYISIQRKRKDYIKWIPKVDKKEITLKLDKNEERWYNELCTTFECKELEISCPNVLSRLTKLRMLTAKSSEKINFILNYIEDYPDENVIIASTFSSILEELSKMIPNAQLLTGNTNTQIRKQIEDKFNQKQIKYLLCNIDVIKEGMKLEACNCMIVLDPSLTYTDNEQLEDRLLPTTETSAVDKDKQEIIYLVAGDTIDIQIRHLLNQKRSSVDIINNLKSYVENI